jgi:hypothetical protein
MKWIIPNNDEQGSMRVFDDDKDSIIHELFNRWLFKDRTPKEPEMTIEEVYDEAVKVAKKYKFKGLERQREIALYCMERVLGRK